MKRNIVVLIGLAAFFAATSAGAAEFIIVNGDVAGEGLNDLTPVDPVPGNPGTTLGEQRRNLLEGVAGVWAARIESSVPIRIIARFNPMGGCLVLGSTSPGTVYRDFPGAPVPNCWFHSCIADSITGTDLNPSGGDFTIRYNSDIDDPNVCAQPGFYYGMDGEEPTGAIDLFPVVLHEMGHGLGFASFVNESTGVQWGGYPDIFGYYTLDIGTGLHWTEMTNAERVASAINSGKLQWDGPHATDAVGDRVFRGFLQFEVTGPGGIAGSYESMRSDFGGTSPDLINGDFELVDTGAGTTPSDGCTALVGFTAGNVALVDRGQCEFGLKALNAENAGASAVVVMNNDDSSPDALVIMQGGDVGDQVTIPAVFVSYSSGNLIKGALPGVQGSLGPWYPTLYAPNPVDPGSSVAHWDEETTPDLLMEPFASDTLFNDLDMTPDLLWDVGHTIIGVEVVFHDGFESGDTGAWANTTP